MHRNLVKRLTENDLRYIWISILMVNWHKVSYGEQTDRIHPSDNIRMYGDELCVWLFVCVCVHIDVHNISNQRAHK